MRLFKLMVTIFLFVFFGRAGFAQNSVGIGTGNPNENSVLELVSTNNDQGFLVPRLTTFQVGSGPGDRLYIGDFEYFEDGGAGNQLLTNSHIIPILDNSRDLGTASFGWRRIFSNNSLQIVSDIRLKKDITKLEYGLEELMRLDPVKYMLKSSDSDSYNLGLIAQDVLKVIPEVVNGDEMEGMLSIGYSELVPVLIRAIQEQQEEIKSLRTEKESYDLRISRLEKYLDELTREAAGISSSGGLK